MSDKEIDITKILVEQESKKPHNKITFSAEIQERVNREQISYMEALMHYIEEYDMAETTVSKLLTPCIKEELKKEAYQMNLIRREKPLFN